MEYPLMEFDSRHLSMEIAPSFTEKPLYEDEWVKIFPSHLELEWYYIPTAANRDIDMHDIRAVYYRKQCTRGECPSCRWGEQKKIPIWWGADRKRCHRDESTDFYNVVIDNGEAHYKGFTTNKLETLLSLLLPRLPATARIVEDQLPFMQG